MMINMIISPAVLVIVEAIKRAEIADKRWLPIIALIIGTLAGSVWALTDRTLALQHVLEGLLYGAAAAGIYDASKSAVDKG